MKLRSILRTSGAIPAFALLLAMNPSTLTAQKTDSAQISSLLSDAQHQAMLLSHDAATLKSYAMSNLAWQTHASQIEQIRKHVNNLGEVTKQLNDMQSKGSPWQQEAISQIDPLLQEMADHLTATINHLNEGRNQVKMPPFRDYINANYQLANKTYETVKDLVAYDQAKSQVQALEQKLQTAPVN